MYLQPVDDGLPMRESGPWAAVKLDYLRRYIDVFETSMRNKWRIRYYIDLLSGPGKNLVGDTGEILLGSPLLALTTKFPFTGYFFVDASEENTSVLQQRCNTAPNRNTVDVRTGDCNVIVNEIIAQIRDDTNRSLNLAFLDPEGLELQWTTVATLATMQRMDLIINYPQGGLNRYMKQAFIDEGNTPVDQFFGGREWRDLFDLHGHTSAIHWRLIELYRDKLRGLGYIEVRRDDEIGDEPLIRNAQRRAPLYRLLFASKHGLGNEFWHKVTRRDMSGQMYLPFED